MIARLRCLANMAQPRNSNNPRHHDPFFRHAKEVARFPASPPFPGGEAVFGCGSATLWSFELNREFAGHGSERIHMVKAVVGYFDFGFPFSA